MQGADEAEVPGVGRREDDFLLVHCCEGEWPLVGRAQGGQGTSEAELGRKGRGEGVYKRADEARKREEREDIRGSSTAFAAPLVTAELVRLDIVCLVLELSLVSNGM